MKAIRSIATWSGLLIGHHLQAQEINICSHCQPFFFQPFLHVFNEESGIETKLYYSKKGLAQRLKSEERNSPADVVLTVDIKRLSAYNSMDFLAQTISQNLKNYIPSHPSLTDNSWFALSKRSLIFVTYKDRVAKGELTRIEDLADPKRKRRVYKRPGSLVCNGALMPLMITHHGTEAAEEWVNGLVANLAQKLQGNGHAQVKAIFEYVCDVLLNHNHDYGKMKSSEERDQQAWTASMNIIYSNQGVSDRRAHINVSGDGVAINSKNKETAVKLLKFFSQARSQQLYSEINFECPANPRVKPTEVLVSWGAFKEDQLPIESIAKLSRQAQMMADLVEW